MPPSALPTAPPSLALVEDANGVQLSISHVEQMPPFLMSVLSNNDLWMFVASNGGLTAGRVNADQSLFPYETADRLYERPGLGGPFTLVRIRHAGEPQIWAPFALRPDSASITRRLTKSALGDRICFEETDPRSGLDFSYEWMPSEHFGWVRKARLLNSGPAPVSVDLLDGLLDVLPAGVQLQTQQRASNLIDAYRHTELHPDVVGGLALYSLSSLLTDRVEPAEALRANAIWQLGLTGRVHLAADVIRPWRLDTPRPATTHLRGKKGAFLVDASVVLEPGVPVEWSIVGDVFLDAVSLADLRAELATPDLAARLDRTIVESRQGLAALVASLDGQQHTAHLETTANHVSNAMFNGLRGGVIVDDGYVPKTEVVASLQLRNHSVAEHHREWLEALPDAIDVETLRRSAVATHHPDLARLVDETMPLALGRRHGDPSRPWNRFSIHTRNRDGSRRLHYEGNWRDIFQNWEALALSYPEYLPSMIAKFANALTVDGYNPYRISRDGIDWEVPDPEDPWSNIGYWNDHQVIYLLRLLEALQRYRPELLTEMLDARRFSFADVPYRIATYTNLIRNPQESIEFDEAIEKKVEERVAQVGQDGRLVWHGPEVVRTHLWEKLFIVLLAKLSNLVVDGGIWMNTQRPEWNDANNALPGFGLSVVTLAHTLRFVRFLDRLVDGRSNPVTMAVCVRRWLEKVAEVIRSLDVENRLLTPAERRSALDRLGQAFSEYREVVYAGWPTGIAEVSKDAVQGFFDATSRVLERSLRSNRRPDGLFHSYNTMALTAEGLEVRRLSLMLEGQVSALDAQVLEPDEAAQLVEAMYASDLYRSDLDTFLLYPDKTLPDVEARNCVSSAAARAIPIVARWLDTADTRVVSEDRTKTVHFHPDLKNADVLEERLDALDAEPNAVAISDEDRAKVLDLYEQTFHHAGFTGRSASMYGFEGLGCVYWHMVAKLLVAVQETHARAVDEGRSSPALADAYFRIRDGFGFNKTPAEYGAFPTDAYSHSPGHSGAQQPGMTGQVKEQILTRFGELGLRMREGCLEFAPTLLKRSELFEDETSWPLLLRNGLRSTTSLPPMSLGFTLAGVVVIYVCRPDTEDEHIELGSPDGQVTVVDGLRLDATTTQAIFKRTNMVSRIEVHLAPGRFS